MMPIHAPMPGRLAVCSWSLQARDQHELIERLVRTGIRNVQLALDPLRETPAAWDGIESLLARNNITVISGMLGCVGEDYTTLESIKRTGGIAPDATWAENLANFREGAAIASRLGLKLVTFHAGFLPRKTDAGFPVMKERLETLASLFAERKIALGLETGQETAGELAELMRELADGKNNNIGVNFDPGNMILYGKGDPVAALRALAPWLRQIHIKDARHAKTPGAWGEEVPAGRGDVDWAHFFETLRELGYGGDFAIEREAGMQRVEDIREGREFLGKFV
ncbi:sugar phosphate isomerase/epimerase [Termitidicoccus mucosus]|uniref:Xylose isomerase-like TIM barrel domain-containing protein n=1 Tax=Termitidicoccus mucosus TaxID=1184151 RepID=A0A178INA6_9BACT|nr:hypothetical protein AW736_00500 [Opitutaceae bacterium TSB47]